MTLKIVAISDTHMRSIKIPKEGDVLIHAGDLTFQGTPSEIWRGFNQLQNSMEGHSYQLKLFCAGNHDWLFATHPTQAKEIAESFGWVVLQDELIEFEGVRFFGSPRVPIFGPWAFGHTLAERAAFWDGVPDCDVLITHGPAQGLRDNLQEGGGAGCEAIRKYIDKVQPKLHICGHLHFGYGQVQHNETTVINAACCDDAYKAVNKPVEIDYIIAKDD